MRISSGSPSVMQEFGSEIKVCLTFGIHFENENVQQQKAQVDLDFWRCLSNGTIFSATSIIMFDFTGSWNSWIFSGWFEDGHVILCQLPRRAYDKRRSLFDRFPFTDFIIRYLPRAGSVMWNFPFYGQVLSRILFPGPTPGKSIYTLIYVTSHLQLFGNAMPKHVLVLWHQDNYSGTFQSLRRTRQVHLHFVAILTSDCRQLTKSPKQPLDTWGKKYIRCFQDSHHLSAPRHD